MFVFTNYALLYARQALARRALHVKRLHVYSGPSLDREQQVELEKLDEHARGPLASLLRPLLAAASSRRQPSGRRLPAATSSQVDQ